MAVLVGMDATPEPGLRGPTNFAGTLYGEDVLRLNQTLTAARHVFSMPMASIVLTHCYPCMCPFTCVLSKHMVLEVASASIFITKCCSVTNTLRHQ